jgi:predicted DCC family thiol-disulfide oxidoreductase YuxK
MRVQDQYDIVLFDGVCNLCNNAVDFIIKRDKAKKFKLAALQDKAGALLLKQYNIPDDYLDSIILIRGNQFFYKTDAVIEIAKNMSGIWQIFGIFILIPKAARNWGYDLIARNRYKWFGKKETCRLPTLDEQSRFLKLSDLNIA